MSILVIGCASQRLTEPVERLLNPAVPGITTPSAAGALSEKGFQHTTGLSTSHEVSLALNGIRLRIASMPGRHEPWLLPPFAAGTVFKPPLSDFQREVQAAALETNVQWLRHGETYSFDARAPYVHNF